MKIRIAICLTLILVFGGGFVLFHTTIREKDLAQYKLLVEQVDALRSTEALERHPSHQKRETVEKDIWRVKEGERSHFHVSSDRSILSLKQHKANTEISEQLENIIYWDENPDTWLHAATGSYEYPSLEMHAEVIECGHSLGSLKAGSAIVESLEGQILHLHDHVTFLPSSLTSTVKISSSDAVCDWEKSSIEFFRKVAIELEQSQEKIRADGGMAIYETNVLTLYPEESEERCHVWRDVDRIDAKEIRFHFLSEEIHCLNVVGQMQSIQNKESFIVADKVVYRCPSQVLVLSAESPANKVLFWQEGCSLSASEIEIKKDPETGEEIVVGKGDVHFSFTVDEQNMINRLISQYL